MGRIQGYELIIPESISHRKARIVCYIKNDVAFKELKIPPDLDIYLGAENRRSLQKA